MDIVFINGLTFSAIIGIYDYERESEQRVRLDIEMAVDIEPAAQSEDISLAVDYKQVADEVTYMVQSRAFKLVETMAHSICDLVLSRFAVRGVRVRASKPDALANAVGVGVQVERGSWSNTCPK